MASSDRFGLVVKGRQTHGAMPWGGVDPIVVSSQIVTTLQAIVSRQVDLTTSPAVVTVGTIQGGVRFNIIPDSVSMTGTIRAFDPKVREQVSRQPPHRRAGRGERWRHRAVHLGRDELRHLQRSRAHRAATPDARACRRRRQGVRRPADDDGGGLLALPAEGAGPLRLPRRHAHRHRPAHRAAQPQPPLLRRQARTPRRDAVVSGGGGRLSERRWQMTACCVLRPA